VGFFRGEHESDPERYGRSRITDVVDGIGEQRHASETNTTTNCRAAVAARIRNDHLIAEMPRAVARVNDPVGVSVSLVVLVPVVPVVVMTARAEA
jgi:hypothetical protein